MIISIRISIHILLSISLCIHSVGGTNSRRLILSRLILSGIGPGRETVRKGSSKGSTLVGSRLDTWTYLTLRPFGALSLSRGRGSHPICGFGRLSWIGVFVLGRCCWCGISDSRPVARISRDGSQSSPLVSRWCPRTMWSWGVHTPRT